LLTTLAGKTKVTSRVVRAMCIMSHPIPNTDNAHSVQIILPQKQIGRRSGGYAQGVRQVVRALLASAAVDMDQMLLGVAAAACCLCCYASAAATA
jgi:hypothetical protein